MNLRPLLAFLVVAPLLNGCVVRPHVQEARGDIQFNWKFQGFTCQQDPQVAFVHIDIPGETLQGTLTGGGLGDYPCSSNSLDGITLHDFAPGNYSFTIAAFDANGNRLYGPNSGTFHVNGSIVIDVDLDPVGGPVSAVALQWTLAATGNSNNPACADAIPNGEAGGITSMLVKIDNGDFFTLDCAAGQTVNGASIGVLSNTTHTITLVAAGNSGFEYEQFDGVFSPSGSGTTAFAFDFNAQSVTPWLVGGTEFTFQLNGHAVNETCAAAGVDQVFVDFKNTTSLQFVYGGSDASPGLALGCFEPHDLLFPYLPPGHYEVRLSAGTAGLHDKYADAEPARFVTITEGVFATSPEFNMLLTRTVP